MDLNFTCLQKTFRCVTLLVLFTLSATGLLMGQTQFSTVVSPENPGLTDYIQVDYIIENAKSIEKFSPPVFKDLELVQGPSRSSNMTIINGAMSQSQTFSYVLRAQEPGKHTIPGAIAIIDGKTMRSNAVTVNVDKQARTRPGTPPGQQQSPLSSAAPDDTPDFRPGVNDAYRLAPGEDAAAKIARNLFVKLEVNKTSCYVGEPIIATYKLYSRLRSESSVTKRPSLNGFSVYDMNVPREKLVTIEQVNGKDFHVRILRRIQLLPLQPGNYTLEPIEMRSDVEFLRMGNNTDYRPRSNNPMQRLIDEFFGRHQDGIAEEHAAVSKSESVTVQVAPLPAENKPAGFNGAVGKFSMEATLKKKAYTAGDVAELSVTIRGKGNLPMINPPALNLPEGMEAFEPSVNDTINKAVYPLSGEKLIDYTFLLNKQGDYPIPPFSFSYFDPAARTYKTISSDTFLVHVAANSKLAAQERDNKKLAIANSPSGWTDIIKVEMAAGAAIILLLLGIIIYLLKRNQHKAPVPEAPPSPSVPEKHETKTFTDPLAAVRTALAAGDNQEFYSGINRAIREAVYEKTATSVAYLTSLNMPFILREKAVPEETIAMVESLMKKCEIALYTPVHQERDKIAILAKAEAIIKSLQVEEEALAGR